LEDALRSDFAATDIPLAVEVNYFRLGKNRYFVPISVKVPGSAVTLAQKSGTGETVFDFIGRVQNQRKQSVTMRDTVRVKLSEADTGKLAQRSLQYDMGVQLEPGTYTLKMLARENQDGKVGTFETSFVVPNMDAQPPTSVRLSSVVWSGQREDLAAAVGAVRESRKSTELNPLVSNGQKTIPSVTRTFKQGQTLYVFFELYDTAPNPSVSANVTFLKGSKVELESKGIRVSAHPADRAEAVPVLMQVPLTGLTPGSYTVQLNVVDENSQRFFFDRSSLQITQ
jgi:methionine-rich copper-binding protein CopC